MDLCLHKGKDYLVVVDYYSRWIEAIVLSSTTSEAIVQKLKEQIKTWGFPREIVSDNGPQFTGSAFQEFVQKYDIRHITSSPHVPSSNGEAEMAVKVAKDLLDQEDPWLAFLTHRDTPIAATGQSPSQLMMCRHLRTTLPVVESNLEPTVFDSETVRQRDDATKAAYARSYDNRHGSRELEPLPLGQPVAIKTDTQKDWSQRGTVTATASTPRSYQVETPKGTIRRNRRHLRPAPSVPPPGSNQQDVLVPEPTVPPETAAVPVPAADPPGAPPEVEQSTQVRRSARAPNPVKRLIEEC